MACHVLRHEQKVQYVSITYSELRICLYRWYRNCVDLHYYFFVMPIFCSASPSHLQASIRHNLRWFCEYYLTFYYSIRFKGSVTNRNSNNKGVGDR